MIYLDTHVVVWLYQGDLSVFSPKARRLMERKELMICPMVYLELAYLREIGKIKTSPGDVLESLSASVGLSICQSSFLRLVTESVTLSWTRDPFDRLIVAAAIVANSPLLTKDRNILEHFKGAKW